MASNSDSAPFDVDGLIDGQALGWRVAPLIIVAMLALACDGFDLAAMGYVVPELVKQWHLPPTAFVTVFSAGIVGLMIGGPGLGLLGDRLGRRKVAVAGLFAIAFATLATMAARNVPQLMVLRFLTGVGLGGVIPNVVALVAELTPRRARGRLLVTVTLGMPLGIALPGLVAGAVVAKLGWPGLLLVGGVLPLAAAAAVRLVAPESPKFLLERGRGEEAKRALQALRPELAWGKGTNLSVAARTEHTTSRRELFAGSLLFATPLLWICQAASQMANFFSLTWLPTLLQSAGASTAEAGAHASLFALGGLAAGVVLIFVIDRLGAVPLIAMFAVGVPLVAELANPDLGPTLQSLVIAGAGMCVTGVNFCLTALLPIFYPTAVRSLGTGWTQAAGRVGALAAPVLGGILLGKHLPIGQLTFAPAAFMVVGMISAALLTAICIRQFGGTRVGEFA